MSLNNSISIGKTAKNIPDDWEIQNIDKVCDRYSGHTPNKKISSYWNGDIPWISLKDTSKLDKLFIDETEDYTTNEGINNSSAVLLPAGTVVISRDATVGKIGIMKKKMATSQHFINYVCGDRINNYFLYYYLTSLKNEFNRAAVGSTIVTIGLDFFRKLKVVLPSIVEQEKIVEILLTWDKAIELKEKLVEEKKNQKTGLMQKLLTGKVRLSGFDGEWKEVRVSKAIKESKIVETKPFREKQITVRLHLNGVQVRDVNGTEKLGSTTLYKRFSGQFIYGKQNFHNGALGLIPCELDGYVTSSDIPSFDFNNGFDPHYFFYYWSRSNVYSSLEGLTTGTGSKRLNPKTFLNLNMKVPGLEEQENISQVIKVCDKEIQLLEKELEHLKEQKKGLMQLLLTGIVRVNIHEN